jgi:glucose/arabinose dehydrogenase
VVLGDYDEMIGGVTLSEGISGMIRKLISILSVLLIATVVLILVLNVSGWRARVLSRLLSTENQPVVVSLPPNFKPQVPPGFQVSVLASGFEQPRWMAVAPNGDLFIADSGAGSVEVLHSPIAPNSSAAREIFADHLNLPFGIAFLGNYVYVAGTNQICRFLFDPKTSKRLGNAEPILDLPGYGYNQHWTRSLAFSPDGKHMFVSVGSKSNVGVESDPRRAAILVADPDGKNTRIFASGLRNAVGIAFDKETNQLWASVNERDGLGEDIPSDFFTHIVDGGFYGWPYAYLSPGGVDDRVSSRPDLAAKTIPPDVLLGAHVAPLQFAFYEAQQFPQSYWHGAFIAEHGSWNRRIRSGYQVVFVPFRNGSPSGPPVPFFYGFVPDPAGKEVYGRMVGVAVAADGSLLISDDGQKLIWSVSFD